MIKKSNKVYFSIKGHFIAIFALPLVLVLTIPIIVLGIINGQIIMILFALIILDIMVLGLIFGYIYGFKITDEKIRIISSVKCKTFERKEISKIIVRFVKKETNYEVEAYVYKIDKSKPFIFWWDYIHAGRYGKYNFNITDENVDIYVQSLSCEEEFYVEVVK